jgi:hypothetical protein
LIWRILGAFGSTSIDCGVIAFLHGLSCISGSLDLAEVYYTYISLVERVKR